MVALLIVLFVVGYLLIGYGWAMLVIHVLTDGRYEALDGSWRRAGVGWAMFHTLCWPPLLMVVVIWSATAFIFSADVWKKLYRL